MPLTITIALSLVVLSAACYDLRFRRIPNWLSASGLLTGLALNSALHGFMGLRSAALGVFCAFAVYLPLYLLRGMGAGDVKLMMAVGALAGPVEWTKIFVLTALLGGLASVALILYKRRARQTLVNVGVITAELAQFRAPAAHHPALDFRNRDALRLPHAVIIALGSLLAIAFPQLARLLHLE